jgi:hypothetical protein
MTGARLEQKARDQRAKEQYEAMEHAAKLRLQHARRYDRSKALVSIPTDIFIVGDDAFPGPVVQIEVRQHPMLIAVELICPARGCRQEYVLSKWAFLKEGMNVWFPCRICHHPVSLDNTFRVYGPNSYPARGVQATMRKNRGSFDRWMNLCWGQIEEAKRKLAENDDPTARHHTLVAEDEDTPAIKMKFSIEGDDETMDSVPQDALDTWGFGKSEVPAHLVK